MTTANKLKKLLENNEDAVHPDFLATILRVSSTLQIAWAMAQDIFGAEASPDDAFEIYDSLLDEFYLESEYKA